MEDLAWRGAFVAANRLGRLQRRQPVEAEPLDNHHLSTFGRQSGILVCVHSVLSESLTFGDVSVHGPNRMDNILKAHT